jgi:hypothetical protein
VTLSPSNPATGVRLTNQGPTTARWTAAPTDGRISVSPRSGTLAPGNTVNINVGVDGRALATGVTIGGGVVFGGGRAQVVLAVSASGPPPTTTTLGFGIVTTTTGRGLLTAGR